MPEHHQAPDTPEDVVFMPAIPRSMLARLMAVCASATLQNSNNPAMTVFSEFLRLDNHMDTVNAQRNQLTAAMTPPESAQERIKAQLDAATTALETAQDKKALLEAQVHELEAEQKRIKAELHVVTTALETDQEQKALLESQVHELEAAQEQIKEQLDAAKTALEAAQEHKAQLEAQVHELETAQERLKAQLEAQVNVLKNAQEHKAQLDAATTALENAQQRNAQLQAQVHELETAQERLKAEFEAQVQAMNTPLPRKEPANPMDVQRLEYFDGSRDNLEDFVALLRLRMGKEGPFANNEHFRLRYVLACLRGPALKQVELAGDGNLPNMEAVIEFLQLKFGGPPSPDCEPISENASEEAKNPGEGNKL